MIGSIRRECLDHVIVLDEQHLRRILREYVDYYHSCRTARSTSASLSLRTICSALGRFFPISTSLPRPRL